MTHAIGADPFILGGTSSRYYDDRSSLSDGQSSYARITDFTPTAQGGRLQLTGTVAQYFLGPSPVSGVPGTGPLHDTNGKGVFDPSYDELISIIDSPEALTPPTRLPTRSLSEDAGCSPLSLSHPASPPLRSTGYPADRSLDP